MFRRKNIAIDLGTETIQICDCNMPDENNIIINDSNVIAVNEKEGTVRCIGKEARAMMGREPNGVRAFRPLGNGVIEDYNATVKVIEHFLGKACKGSLLKPRIMICVPSKSTEIEKQTVFQAALGVGAKEVHIIEEPIAAAFGAGVPFRSHKAHMIVDIGGGTTDIAVIVNGRAVVSEKLEVAGHRFNQDIQRYLKNEKHFRVGESTAEEIKMAIGWVSEHQYPQKVKVRGRSLVTGSAGEIIVDSYDTFEALSTSKLEIIQKIKKVLAETPTEIQKDILNGTIILTGGGSKLKGLPDFIRKTTQINTMLAKDPELCVVRGSCLALRNIKFFKDEFTFTESKYK